MPTPNPHIRRYRRSPWGRRLRLAIAIAAGLYVVGVVALALKGMI